MEKIKRDTSTDLMNNVLALVKENGCYAKAEKIMDYFLTEDFDNRELSDYQFDFFAVVNFGGSEGIYIDCFIRGHFDENAPDQEQQQLRLGTFKTLGESLNDMQIMGELCGALTYYESQYVNRELDRYTPTAQREAEEKRRAERAQKGAAV